MKHTNEMKFKTGSQIKSVDGKDENYRFGRVLGYEMDGPKYHVSFTDRISAKTEFMYINQNILECFYEVIE